MTRYMFDKLSFGCVALAVLLGLKSAAYGDVAAMDVTVFDVNSQVAFRGPTKANGTFATRNLQPGNYVVQFNARTADVTRNDYLLVVSAGKKKVIADAVRGEKFTRGGVAMRVDVGARTKITGQVANGETALLDGSEKFHIINGHRYVWQTGELGSNFGGHWVEEGVAPAENIIRWSPDEIRKMQDRRDEGSMIPRSHHHFEPPDGK